MKKSLLLFLGLVVSTTSHAEIIKREYSAYSAWIDCDTRSLVMVSTSAGVDQGNIERRDAFDYDPGLDARCQQTNRKPYSGKFEEGSYHRGHLVNANLFDGNRQLMDETFYMTNIVPQNSVSNIGAWKQTEVIQECWRGDEDAGKAGKIFMFAGPLYSDPSNDHFLRSHGVRTPEYMWKLLISDQQFAAWVIPNNRTATKENLDNFLVSINELEHQIGFKLGLDDEMFDKDYKPALGLVTVNSFCFNNLRD